MTLIKTSILSFIATVIKIIAGLVVNKAIATYIGPSGLALIGQFQNFTQMVMTVAQGGINSGVTKYTAEYGAEDARVPLLFSTAVKISLITSAIAGSGVILFSRQASLYFLKSDAYSYIFVIFGFTIVLFVTNNLLLSMLNGLKEIKTWVYINIIQSIYALIFTSILIVWLGLDGAFIALVTNQSMVFFIVLWVLRRHKIICLANLKKVFNKPEAKKLAGFSAIAIFSAITVPLSHLLIRNYIGETLGWDMAGYWQAIWYISTMYLLVVTTTLGIYYLPRLSEITDKAELRKELWQGYKVIMPIVIFTSLGVYLLKDLIIWLLFTKDFTPMRDLFLWQLVGDVFKLAAWLIAYLMLAKAMTKTMILTEVIFSTSFILFSILFINLYGLIGMSYAFALNYFIYFFVIYLVTKKEWTDDTAIII